MQSDFYEQDGHLIVSVSGKLDTIHAPEFLKVLEPLLQKKTPSCLLDLSEVGFLSSSGLQVLLSAAKISKENGTKFAVFGMQEMVNEVFEMSGFNHFIQSFTCKEDALAA
jgi:anti-anti-sigma factor